MVMFAKPCRDCVWYARLVRRKRRDEFRRAEASVRKAVLVLQALGDGAAEQQTADQRVHVSRPERHAERGGRSAPKFVALERRVVEGEVAPWRFTVRKLIPQRAIAVVNVVAPGAVTPPAVRR